MKKIVLFFLLLLAASVPAQQIDSPVSIQGVDATVVVSAAGTVSGELNLGKITLKVLTFQETQAQKIKSINETISINGKAFPAEHELDSLGNNYAVFEISETGSFSYNITARIETNSLPVKLEEFDLSQKIAQFQEFAQPTENVESDDARVRTLALNKFAGNSWLETLRAVSEWTNNYVKYDWAYYPETYSTLEVIESKKGVCDEFATLSTGMLRAKGIPTRFAVGAVYSGQQWGYHAWNEAFHPKSNWVPLDTTYAETGIVDGTHITMGYFTDPAKAVDFFVAPATANVIVNPKQVSVELHSKKPFTGIFSLNAKNIEITTGKWFPVKVEAENLLASHSIVPLQLVVPKEISVSEATKNILFAPKEKKTIEWMIRADASLEENQFLVGEYKIISMQGEITNELKVLPGNQEQEEASIEIIDILPKISGKNLEIEIALKNIGQKTGTAKAGITGTPIESTKTIAPLSTETVLLVVENYENKAYELFVTGESINASITILPKEGREKPTVKETVEKPENPLQPPPKASTPFTEQNTLLLIAGAGSLATLLILKELFWK